jgi:hypothetical protein
MSGHKGAAAAWSSKGAVQCSAIRPREASSRKSSLALSDGLQQQQPTSLFRRNGRSEKKGYNLEKNSSSADYPLPDRTN